MIGNQMVTSEQVRAARALLRWEQKDLASASMVSLPSIQRLETKPGPLAAQARTVAAIRAALESAGVIFVDENGEGSGVRLRKERPMTNQNFEHAFRNDLRRHGFRLRGRPDGTYEIYSGQYISAAGLTIEGVEAFTKDAEGHRERIQAEILKKRPKE
jgi:transcriptional regulator with XRE-family HTH domain